MKRQATRFMAKQVLQEITLIIHTPSALVIKVKTLDLSYIQQQKKKKNDRAGACKARGQESASTIMKKRGRENRDENEKARHTSIIHARIELDNYGAALDGLEKIVGRFRRPRGLR